MCTYACVWSPKLIGIAVLLFELSLSLNFKLKFSYCENEPQGSPCLHPPFHPNSAGVTGS